MRKALLGCAILVAAVVVPQWVYSHCQVPCGIYDDYARIERMREDATTVGKAITEINALAGKTDAKSANQLARWVVNKESHAENIIGTIANYYLTQRVKPDASDYAKRLQAHHAVMIAAMKAKQDANPATVSALTGAIEAIAAYYPKHDH
jgi:nickel superoxide dismutase